MKQIIKCCSNIGSDVLGFVRIGSNTISIINKNKDVKGILNGCEIFKVANLKDEKCNVAYVIGDLIQNIYNKNKPEYFTVYKDHWASDKYPMKDILDQIIFNLKNNVKVAVKVRSKESNTNFKSSLNFSEKINPNILNKNIGILNVKMGNTCIVLQNIIKCASIMVGRKFADTGDVWGARHIQKYMEGIKSKLASDVSEVNKIDFYKEMMDKNTNKLNIRLASEEVMNNPEEKKVISQVIIPDTISNYENIKDIATKSILAIAPLIYVDDIFRKNTNYPVNWFVSDDVLINIKDDYNFLINFLQEIPRIESNAIMPLDVYSTQIIK
jgi:hypothetical protein